jgi:putative flippase GtrA
MTSQDRLPAPPGLASLARAIAPHLHRAIGFAAVSGAGLAIDLSLFMILIRCGAPAGAASFVSGSAAVTFVYFASVRRIFSYQGRFLFTLFAAYLAYQAAGVGAASWAVSALVANHVAPVLAKLLILPVTFPANYLFMSLLTGRRRAMPGAAA